MAAKTIDRRVRRTRTALQHALIALILKKGYDAVTVEDICTEADIGRSTFYLHYSGKDDLKRSGLEHLRDQLARRQQAAAANGARGTFAFIEPLFEHAAQHAELYRALAGSRGGEIFLGGIREVVGELAREELAAWHGRQDGIRREAAVSYLAGACISVLVWWLEAGTEEPAAQMAALLRAFAENGVLQPVGTAHR